ncbi:MAG: hypothetical protein WAV15_00480 [Minisyncoccia bacterium]
MKDQQEISVDMLKHLENLSNKVNKLMANRAKNVFQRYPITFGLLILFGVISLHEGLKGAMKELGLLDLNPWYLLVTGLAILAITGNLYKKLEK